MFRHGVFLAPATAILGATLLLAPIAVAQQVESAEHAETVASFNLPIPRADDQRSKHPLYPAMQLAERVRESIAENVHDYTCTIVRRERVAGKLGKHEFINAKIRYGQGEAVSPFSVYLRFLKPASVEGREALFVDGQHGGKVFVRRGGQRMAYVSSYIKPDSRLAMRENRYPITEVGFERLTDRLIEVIENDMLYDECEVTFYKGAKVNGRSCTRVEVVHPIERDHFEFHRAMVFVDDEYLLPVGYASFYWPREPGGKPRLLEEYIYTDVELNVGLTDADFDRDNPKYGFTRKRDAVN